MKTTVTASQPSRWRAGRQFGPQPVEIEISTPADAVAMQAILADRVLQVADRDAVAAHVDQLLAAEAEAAAAADRALAAEQSARGPAEVMEQIAAVAALAKPVKGKAAD